MCAPAHAMRSENGVCMTSEKARYPPSQNADAVERTSPVLSAMSLDALRHTPDVLNRLSPPHQDPALCHPRTMRALFFCAEQNMSECKNGRASTFEVGDTMRSYPYDVGRCVPCEVTLPSRTRAAAVTGAYGKSERHALKQMMISLNE
ncbi:hypothetical protein DFH09DRAFT_1342343 [Mycena vulgaris]|nr:hypothetical protein DFH09DRAFT_1342343 [Mycena vulgaris]